MELKEKEGIIIAYTSKKNIDVNKLSTKEKNKIIKGIVKRRRQKIHKNIRLAQWKIAYDTLHQKSRARRIYSKKEVYRLKQNMLEGGNE